MNKVDTLNYIKEKKGWIPYKMIFNIFSDDDEIPPKLIEMSINDTDNNRTPLIITSSQIADELNKIMDIDFNNKI